jgi:hypothetical protein
MITLIRTWLKRMRDRQDEEDQAMADWSYSGTHKSEEQADDQ